MLSPNKRPLHVIAKEIEADWLNPPVSAIGYIGALKRIESTHDFYYADRGANLVYYFLQNSSEWTGAKAEAIKEEIHRHLDGWDEI